MGANRPGNSPRKISSDSALSSSHDSLNPCQRIICSNAGLGGRPIMAFFSPSGKSRLRRRISSVPASE